MDRGVRLGVLAMGAVWLVQCAWAQSSAHSSIAIGDGQLTATIEFQQPFTQPASNGTVRVSGTEANVTVGWTAVTHDPAVVTIQQTKVWIGGEALTLPPAFDGGAVRFAPTHFPDVEGPGGLPKVKWEVTARLQCSAHNVDDTKTVTVELDSDPWSKATVYGTAISGSGQADLLFSLVSSETTSEAATRLGTNGHTVAPSGNKLAVAKGAIVAALDEATCYLAVAHGDPGGVNDSFGWQQQPAQYLSFAGDIHGAVSARHGNGVPKFRYAVLYSCDTLTGASAEPYPQFNMQDLDESPRDSVYCGFDEVVMATVAPGNTDEWVDLEQVNVRLSEHAKKLFAHWCGDTGTTDKERTIEFALQHANEQMMPRGLPVADPSYPSGFKCKAVPMRWRGDPRTTLRRVYLTESEQSAADIADEPTFWYYVWND